MKRIDFFMLVVILLVIACTKDTVTESYTFFRPVYKTKEAVRAGIRNGTPGIIQKTGKLVWKDNYIFLNDVDRGIHIIDVSNPSQIKPVSFISIPGCIDLAINGNYLYADCYTDLVTLDISDPLNTVLKQFLPGVFPHRYYNGFVADTTKVIQEWVRVDTSVKKRFSETLTRKNRFGNVFFSSQSAAGMAGSASATIVGVAGSMARFALLNQRMYTVSHNDLKVFNTASASAPSYIRSVSLPGGNIETIFPYIDKLFIGSQAGMFIYNAQNQVNPQKISQFVHARACDPVIADTNYAYITLRGGGFCGGPSNQLDVVDINNIATPQLVKTYPLKAPAGLSKDGNLLFICDGTDGLKIFDATTALSLKALKQIPGFEAYDVIAQKGTAVVVAKDGLYMVDYSDVTNTRVMSKLTITANK